MAMNFPIVASVFFFSSFRIHVNSYYYLLKLVWCCSYTQEHLLSWIDLFWEFYLSPSPLILPVLLVSLCRNNANLVRFLYFCFVHHGSICLDLLLGILSLFYQFPCIFQAWFLVWSYSFDDASPLSMLNRWT